MLIFEDQVHLPVPRFDPVFQFVEQVPWAFIDDLVGSIKPKPVDLELLNPVKGVLNDKFPHLVVARPIEVQSRTPGRSMAVAA